MDMMVPEMLCERWTDVSLIARKKETVACCLLVRHRISYNCFVHVWLCAALIKSPRLTHSCFSESTPSIYLRLTEIEPSWLCLYEAAQGCVRIPVQGTSRQTGISLQGSTKILTWAWKLCSHVRTPLPPLGNMVFLLFIRPVSRSLHSAALQHAHEWLHSHCSPGAVCQLFLTAFSQKCTCCGIWLTVKNNVMKCRHSYDSGIDSDFHKGFDVGRIL